MTFSFLFLCFQEAKINRLYSHGLLCTSWLRPMFMACHTDIIWLTKLTNRVSICAELKFGFHEKEITNGIISNVVAFQCYD